MSRIHEALKKAEQERALSQPAGRVETARSVLEPLADPTAVITGASVLAGAAPSPAADSVLSRSRRTNWNPDPKTMLFFSGEEHATGMEEFRTLRSRLYQLR